MLLVAMLIMQLFVKSQINGSNIFYFLSLAVRQESGWLKCLEFHSVLWHSLLGDTMTPDSENLCHLSPNSLSETRGG